MHGKVAVDRVPELVRRVLGVMGIGAGWGAIWAAVFAGLVVAIGFVRPADVDPGEGPVVAGAVGLSAGFMSGMAFGIILAVAENRKRIQEISLLRVAVWGALAAALWPFLASLPRDMMILLCPLGALSASLPLAVVRSVEVRSPAPSNWSRSIGGILGWPLKAVCASESEPRICRQN